MSNSIPILYCHDAKEVIGRFNLETMEIELDKPVPITWVLGGGLKIEKKDIIELAGSNVEYITRAKLTDLSFIPPKSVR